MLALGFDSYAGEKNTHSCMHAGARLHGSTERYYTGKVVEMDSPSDLIKREGGVFRDMCMKSGRSEELRSVIERGITTRN